MNPKTPKASKRRVRRVLKPKSAEYLVLKPKSAEYLRGAFDTLEMLSSIAFHGPIFLQVLATMAGSDIEIPGVEKHTRAQFKKEFAKEKKRTTEKPGATI